MPCEIRHATSCRAIKGEDVMFVHDLGNSYSESMLYVISDGHAGVDAAQFIESTFLPTLLSRLPPEFPNLAQTPDLGPFSDLIRRALCDTFMLVDAEWLEKGDNSGATLTVAMVIEGTLLTVANVGDSDAVLDTGTSMLEVTFSHRIQGCSVEQQRLEKAGCRMAQLGFHLQGPAKPGEPGVGPLRIWPGGLCVSRSIGDADAGPEIIPIPHIRQVLIPQEGCRVIMASDGLWDVLTLSKAVKMTRSKDAATAAAALLSAVTCQSRFNDDTSIIVLDMLPPGVTSFPEAVNNMKTSAAALQVGSAPQHTARRSPSSGGLFSCFSSSFSDEGHMSHGVRNDGDASAGRLLLYSDVDCLTTYPKAREGLVVKPWHLKPADAEVDSQISRDFTMHNEQYFTSRQCSIDAEKGGGVAMLVHNHAVNIPVASQVMTLGECTETTTASVPSPKRMGSTRNELPTVADHA
ncbi:hypothetical protein CEUSTIGMA_g7922.t1 [Chlamydomonas eustigma]|uniref:PPM-type phosphatase domain-containing protein n=1 Tax=Chlamydomonas eustigma TaxID=1157962 RepID=A0A250XBN7_9CHLO|nr:hypothetical protein CEUSTIGMA_g7922.t1 [Chlamydomonas eustigma]|eukprot:GAX80484.1 hypothetical protein CEUSTIGMA_g7922.t1 [Chlamydomonas eustigma]